MIVNHIRKTARLFKLNINRRKYMMISVYYLSTIRFGLLLSTPLLKLAGSEVHDSCSDLIAVVSVLIREVEDRKGFLKM